nr:hypothetical protein [Tanacetum cinerariifolium]
MGDEHLSTIPEIESSEVIKSSVKNLFPIPSESKVTFDNESECDVPVNDEFSLIFTTFSNHLFDFNDNFTSSDDKYLIESSPKFYYLLEEFTDELAHIDSIPPGIEEADFDLEEEIRLVENLVYDNSSPRSPEELNAEITDTIVESLSPSPIPIEDSDSQMEEIDLFLDTDDLMPPGIENDDYDSKRDIHFLSNDTLLPPENDEELAEYINTSSWNCLAFYDDDDEEFSILMSEIYKCSLTAITLDFPIMDSLIMEDEHLDTIPETKLDELIKSSVENLVPIPSNDDENVPKEIYSNPLFDEEIIFIKINPHHFNVESDLIGSFLNRDTLIISSPKFDSLLEEFSGELAHIDLIPPGINEADFDPKEEIRLVEKSLYDNSSPRPPEEFNSKNSDAIIESFSSSPIPVEDSDSLMEDLDLFLTLDDSMQPGIENDDYDSKGDILFLEELLSNDSPSIPKNKSFHFDVPLSPRPLAKPPDDDEIEPDTGLLTTKVVGDISKHYVLMPRLLPTQPTFFPVIDTLLPFSFENEDKVHLLSHRGFKAFQLIFDSPMMIYEGNIPILDVSFFHFYPP